MIRKIFSQTTKRAIFVSALLIIAMVVLIVLRIMFYVKSPDVIFLADRSDAQWIKYDSEIKLESRAASQTKCQFRHVFNIGKAIDHPRITVQALKRYQIIFDGVTVYSSTHEFDDWKKVDSIIFPFTVEAGSHEIIINVESENSHPAVIVYSESLPIRSGSGWLASIDGKSWQVAVLVSHIRQAAEAQKFSSASASLIKILPYIAIVFLLTLITLLTSRLRKENALTILKWRPEPYHIRWALLIFWALLAINNMFKLNFQVGSDIWGHIEYIDFIVTKYSLPLATDGWEMFQAPLNYLLSAPLYALLIEWMDMPWIVKILRIIPIICGLLQIEIVYRVARLVFAGRKDLQIIAIITGALLPLHTYTCQVVGNEPLSGFFISLVIFLCMFLIIPGQKEQKPGYFILMGFAWGLALLSKMTAILLAPVIIIVLLFYSRLVQRSLKTALMPILIMFSTSMLTAGWYYLRNYIKFGNPFVGIWAPSLGDPFAGVWDASSGMQWWQDPSYKTWSQILSFGESLVHPIYAGVKSFWDAIYSTLWLDGLNSGVIDFMPWNEHFMVAGALLALFPSMFILSGMISVLLNKKAVYRNAVVFSVGALALFLIAMMDIFITRTAYSTTKASYTLGLLPCYSILVAAGAEPFLRNKIIRSLALAFFACWAFAAYAAYFVISFQ